MRVYNTHGIVHITYIIVSYSIHILYDMYMYMVIMLYIVYTVASVNIYFLTYNIYISLELLCRIHP